MGRFLPWAARRWRQPQARPPAGHLPRTPNLLLITGVTELGLVGAFGCPWSAPQRRSAERRARLTGPSRWPAAPAARALLTGHTTARRRRASIIRPDVPIHRSCASWLPAGHLAGGLGLYAGFTWDMARPPRAGQGRNLDHTRTRWTMREARPSRLPMVNATATLYGNDRAEWYDPTGRPAAVAHLRRRCRCRPSCPTRTTAARSPSTNRLADG
jgi:hypothetical protein